jgi:hypothetical protein
VLVAVNRSVIHPEMGLGQDVFASVVREAIGHDGSPVLSSIRRALAEKPATWERAGLMIHRRR